MRQILKTDDIIEANALFGTLKAKVHTHRLEEDAKGEEDDETKQLVERLQLRLDREKRQRVRHLIECTSRMQELNDRKAAALAEYEPSLNRLFALSAATFKSHLKESYDEIRLIAAKKIQQDIRSKRTAVLNYHEEALRNKARLANEQYELHYQLAEKLDLARKAAKSRPDEMRAEIREMDRLLEETAFEFDDLRDALLKGKDQLQSKMGAVKEHRLRRFQADADTNLQITKLTAQRDKLRRKYDQLLEQMNFRRNHYRHNF